MNANTRFKRKILAGHAPSLTDPEAYEGQVIVLERDEEGFPTAWITVRHQVKAGVWAYMIRDDRPNLLGKATGYTDMYGRAIGARDAQGPELEAVDEEVRFKITKEAHLRDAERRNIEDEGIVAAKRLGGQIRSAVAQVTRAGGDPLVLVERVRRDLETETDRQLGKAA